VTPSMTWSSIRMPTSFATSARRAVTSRSGPPESGHRPYFAFSDRIVTQLPWKEGT
jgi:hypothetical protein